MPLANPYQVTVQFPSEAAWDALCRDARRAGRKPAEQIVHMALSGLSEGGGQEWTTRPLTLDAPAGREPAAA